MGIRFRRSIRILPGVRLNVGKRGVSTSSKFAPPSGFSISRAW